MIVEDQAIRVAGWRDRFLAGLIDWTILSAGTALPLHFTISSDNPLMVCPSLALYGYFVLAEYKYGQTIGKKALDLKTTKIDGTKISLKQSALNSFGKAFLLPIDFVIGALLTKSKRQRLFNKISDTVVIKVEKVQT